MAKWTEEQKQAARDRLAEKVKAHKETKEVKIFDNNLLQKVEFYNKEEVPVVEEKNGFNDWQDDDKVDSIINTIKILPSNMIKNGRHSIENIQAINAFRVTPELIDAAYSKFQHDLD